MHAWWLVSGWKFSAKTKNCRRLDNLDFVLMWNSTLARFALCWKNLFRSKLKICWFNAPWNHNIRDGIYKTFYFWMCKCLCAHKCARDEQLRQQLPQCKRIFWSLMFTNSRWNYVNHITTWKWFEDNTFGFGVWLCVRF